MLNWAWADQLKILSLVHLVGNEFGRWEVGGQIPVHVDLRWRLTPWLENHQSLILLENHLKMDISVYHNSLAMIKWLYGNNRFVIWGKFCGTSRTPEIMLGRFSFGVVTPILTITAVFLIPSNPHETTIFSSSNPHVSWFISLYPPKKLSQP